MPDAARIRGRPARLDEAVATAAALLDRSRRTAIAGLDADIAAIEAALRLARRIDATVDHRAARATLRDLDVMRTVGWITTTPLQARARADLVALVGDGLDEDWPGLHARLLLDHAPPLFPDRPRRVLHLCPATAAPGVQSFGAGADPAAFLGQVRAALGGRALPSGADDARGCAQLLASASYGVLVWSASRIDGLAIETACGLIDELNATIRFAGLPIPGSGNAAGAAQACAWLTGYPLPVGFAGGAAEHDPWRFDAERMAASGEADAVLWLCTGSFAAPHWAAGLPLVALVAPDARFDVEPEVAITVGRAGVEHAGVLFDPDLGALAYNPATLPTGGPDAPPAAADVLASIASLVGDRSC